MVIDKVGNLNNAFEPKKSKPVSNNKEIKKNDSVEISTEGLKASENSKLFQITKDIPDLHNEKIKTIKEQIKNGTYDKIIDNKVLEMVADKIAEQLLRK